MKNPPASARYPINSAGHLMITAVPTVRATLTVAEARELLIRETKNFETINYIYVLDRAGRLTGVVSVKELFRCPPQWRLARTVIKELVSVRAHTDKERVVHLALRHSLKAVPVVSADARFLGTVPSDVILKILYEESTEDLLRLGGISGQVSYDDVYRLSYSTSLKHRLPWLIVGLAGGLLAAVIVSRFEAVLAEHIILAAFIPLIVYMSGAVSAQMQTFIIRDLAFNPNLKFSSYLSKQIGIVVTMGVVVSLLLYAFSLPLYGQAEVSAVLGIALFCAVATALFTGLIVPFLFSRLRLDPANASGPVGTIVQDVLSIIVYFLVASLIL